MGPTEALAKFALEMDLATVPAEVIRIARRAILDTLGVALAGSREPAGYLIAAQARAQSGPPECVLWGQPGRVDAQSAALANGTVAHALDFDDVNPSMPGHPSVPVLPAVLGMGERLGAPGSAVLAAFIAGVEAECKLGRFSGREAYDLGWHATTTTGVVGAAVGAGRLAGLDLGQMRRAIGLAGSQAGGLRQNFGTMTKPFHVGRAAQSGVLAAELARRGFGASETVIEDEAGYWAVFGRDETLSGSDLGTALGNPFDLISPGIDVKLYPCCASTHAAIDAALACQPPIPAEAIERVVVDVPYSAPLILIHHRPETPLAAKFSLEYCVAAALLDGAVRLSSFSAEAVSRPTVQALLHRVDYRVPDEWRKDANPRTFGSSRVEVHLTDGSVRQAETIIPRGNAENPLSDAELEAKFHSCAAIALGDAGAEQALALIQQIESLIDIRELTAALSAGPTPSGHDLV